MTACCQQLFAEPMGYDLAHHVRQRLTSEPCDRHPAHTLGRTRTRLDLRGVDYKLQREMREDMGDDAGPAMPARDALEPGRLLQRGPVILRGVPLRRWHLRHAAEQAFRGTGPDKK